MKNSGTFNIAAHGDREILITRVFDAPRRLIFDAYTKPDLIKRWLLGPDGWSMPICETDLRAGGKYRYVWRNETVKWGWVAPIAKSARRNELS
jgi:uncharacterized protein YndB with AHSA1/START domain